MKKLFDQLIYLCCCECESCLSQVLLKTCLSLFSLQEQPSGGGVGFGNFLILNKYLHYNSSKTIQTTFAVIVLKVAD